jgi:hypothetical protein
MIRDDCDAVAHISPLPRIEIGRHDLKPIKAERVDHWAEQLREIEFARIWRIVEETARGHGR